MLLVAAMLIAVAVLAAGWKALDAMYHALQPCRCHGCGHALDEHIDQQPC